MLRACYRSINTSRALFVLKIEVIEQLCVLAAKYLQKAVCMLEKSQVTVPRRVRSGGAGEPWEGEGMDKQISAVQ